MPSTVLLRAVRNENDVAVGRFRRRFTTIIARFTVLSVPYSDEAAIHYFSASKNVSNGETRSERGIPTTRTSNGVNDGNA